MRSRIHGRKCVPLQTRARIANVIKHLKANKQSGGVPFNNKYVIALDP